MTIIMITEFSRNNFMLAISYIEFDYTNYYNYQLYVVAFTVLQATL